MPRRRRLVVPQAAQSMELFKAEVMRKEGYAVEPSVPVKFTVARQKGIPLQDGYNGHLTAEHAGRIGGAIGGAMVREMIRQAKEQLAARR